MNETAAINITFSVTNVGEKAYETTLYVDYNSAELEIPIVKNRRGGIVSIKATAANLTVISLGNPVEPESTVSFCKISTCFNKKRRIFMRIIQ